MFNLRVIFIVSCVLLAIFSDAKSVGKTRKLKGDERDEALKLLEADLTKVAAGSGPIYGVDNADSVTAEPDDLGTLYKYKVNLKDEDNLTRNCHVSISTKVWLDKFDEITIKCPGEPEATQIV